MKSLKLSSLKVDGCLNLLAKDCDLASEVNGKMSPTLPSAPSTPTMAKQLNNWSCQTTNEREIDQINVTINSHVSRSVWWHLIVVNSLHGVCCVRNAKQKRWTCHFVFSNAFCHCESSSQGQPRMRHRPGSSLRMTFFDSFVRVQSCLSFVFAYQISLQCTTAP